MFRFALMPLLLVLCACQHQPSPTTANASPAQASPAEDAAFLLPGTYSQQTSLAELEALFGKSNVTATGKPDENGNYHRVVLFPDDPTRRAFVDFYEGEFAGIHSISVRDAGSRWRGKHGVHIGMSLAELRLVNAHAFSFSGFDNQQRGWVHDAWSPARDDEDAQLGKLDVEDDDHMYFGVGLGLHGQDIPADAYPHDENSVDSDDPRYPRLGELVFVAEINATTSLDDEWD